MEETIIKAAILVSFIFCGYTSVSYTHLTLPTKA